MLGLTGAGPTRATFRAVSTAVAVVAALALVLTSCAAGGTGARDEGPAHADSVGAGAAPSTSATASRTPDRVDAVRLVKADARVSAEVKRELKPCAGDEYPVDVSYGELTGTSADDIVVNVLTCGDAVGVGSYVYREEDGEYHNVFQAEEPPVYAEIDRGDLVVTKQVYEKGDPVSSPSGENVITYRWSAGRFTEEYRTHNDYSNAVGGDPAPAPADG
ncbi:lipoprotein CseA [Streptomyces fumigatiscleroticus]|nr:lipoprotein CseA [Streptomyces fumigatiscleroticus]